MITLASRSPRRRDLLGLIVPPDQIIVHPPRDADEDPLDDIADEADLHGRMAAIVTRKADLVAEDVAPDRLIAADTAVVHDGVVLGQPPEDGYESTMRDWLHRLSGQTHTVKTAVELREGPTIRRELVTTAVTFHRLDEPTIDWYIGTDEPRGKAGGYAIQGAGSVLVASVQGSLSNVIGLPLEVLREWW